AVCVGAVAALRGPYVRRVDIPVEGLAPDLDGFRIVQISDLHTGPTMRLAYVQRVVDMTKDLAPDLIALTGDIVDGSVPRLASRGRPSVWSWRTIRRSRRWPSRPASTCNCRDTRTPASSSRGRS